MQHHHTPAISLTSSRPTHRTTASPPQPGHPAQPSPGRERPRHRGLEAAQLLGVPLVAAFSTALVMFWLIAPAATAA